MNEPTEISLDEYRRLTAGTSKPRKPAKARQKAPKGTPKAVEGGYTNRIAKAALNGWYCLESPDCLVYRWRGRGGIVTDYMPYEEATKLAAYTTPERLGQ